MKKSGVYSITCVPTGKVYVGESCDIYRKFKEHKNKLLTNSHCNNHLQNAYNKYGKNSFKYNILELCETSLTKEREHFWVTTLNSLNKRKGFNIKPTDPEKTNLRSAETTKKIYATQKKNAIKRGFWRSAESIQKQVNSKKGYTHSQVTRNKIGIKSIGRVLPKKTDEFKLKMSKLSKEKKLGGQNKRKVHQYTLDNIFVKTWPSVTLAAESVKASVGSICAVCSLTRREKSCKGFIWKYEKM